MLYHYSIIKILLSANIGLVILLIATSFLYNSAILIISPLLTFTVSGVTLLYLIWLRWQIIIPLQDKEKPTIKIGATIRITLLILIFWASFPPVSIALSNLNNTTGHIGDTEIMYHLICGATTIGVVSLVLLMLFAIKVIKIATRREHPSQWKRVLAMSAEVIATIALYFSIYAITFNLTYY